MKVEKSCHAAVPMVVHFVVASRVSYAGALLPIDEVIWLKPPVYVKKGNVMYNLNCQLDYI